MNKQYLFSSDAIDLLNTEFTISETISINTCVDGICGLDHSEVEGVIKIINQTMEDWDFTFNCLEYFIDTVLGADFTKTDIEGLLSLSVIDKIKKLASTI